MKSLLSSFKYAFRGIKLSLEGRNFKIHLIALIIVAGISYYLQINNQDWINIILISTMVLAMEGINTAIERLCDVLHPEKGEGIRNVKDIAAGAVLISAIGAFIIGILIFSKYI